MKKLIVVIFVVVLFSFTFTANAQSSKNSKTDVKTVVNEYYDDAQVKFLVSSIKVIASDTEDIIFLQAAVREELIRSGKVVIVDCLGDTLQVNLIVQYNDKDKSNGRNGKWGEILLTAISKNGLVGSTARSFMESYDHGSYYKKLQDLTKELANKFQFQ